MLALTRIVTVVTLISSCVYGMQQNGLSQKDQKILVQAVNSYNLPNYYKARSPQEISHIINLANYAINDARTMRLISQSATQVSSNIKKNKDWVNLILNEVVKNAGKRLAKMQSNAPKKSKKIAPVLAQNIKNKENTLKIKEVVNPEPMQKPSPAQITREQVEEEQILKIVFPLGVTDVSLHDSAVLLGARRDSVVFRVAESSDLKKLQEIILKFLSFEKIEGFKFSTFDKDTPIHVTLGKIRPAKGAHQYHDAATGLNAPEGARASKKEGLTINTFRLTYSSAGHAWQEKMSYKF